MSNIFFEFINLHHGEEEKEKVIETVKSNMSFRGASLWILVCAIFIASIGLNVNSTAVIIGAMLISPLMGPIVGAGFALATYDFDLLKKSVRNLLIATLVSLIVATVYFFLSPFKETQSELLARTAPNIYDVLIAFFGGLVGVIALTRLEKGNPIPGVAIATALMPPLCTAGYGLAVGNFTFFFGAFYLYCINCVFICISTFLIIRFLKYPIVKTLNVKFEKRLHYGITVLILVLVIPSLYLAHNLFQEKKYHQNVEKFITNELSENGYVLVFKQTNFHSNPKKIELAFLTKTFTDEELKSLHQKLAHYDITNTEIRIQQDTKNLSGEILNKKDALINTLQNELKEYKLDNTETIKEISILFPELKEVSIGTHLINANTDTAKTTTVLLYQTEKDGQSIDINKIDRWLRLKFKTTDIKIVRQD